MTMNSDDCNDTHNVKHDNDNSNFIINKQINYNRRHYHHISIDEKIESIEDLQFKNLRIIQKKNSFKFGLDSVLLANFVKADKNSSIVELCSGSGVISILLTGKTSAADITGIEIQEWFVEMANRSVSLNSLSEKVRFLCADLRTIPTFLKKGSAQTVVVNPPYIKHGGGIGNQNNEIKIARHEVCCTLKDIVEAASYLLPSGGNLFMVHRPNRLVDVFCTMRDFHIEPKYVKTVYPSYGKRPILFLINGRKSANPDLKFLEPLYTYDLDGNYISQETLSQLNTELR